MKALLTISGACKHVERFCLGTIVAAMAILLFANVFSRFVLQDSITFAEELGATFFVALTYLGSPYCVRKCKHIRMTALMERMPEKVAKKYSIVIDFITAAMFLFLGCMLVKYCLGVMKLGSITAAMRIPRWICIAPVPIGCIATGLQYLLLVIMNITDKETYWIGTERRFGESDEEVSE